MTRQTGLSSDLEGLRNLFQARRNGLCSQGQSSLCPGPLTPWTGAQAKVRVTNENGNSYVLSMPIQHSVPFKVNQDYNVM